MPVLSAICSKSHVAPQSLFLSSSSDGGRPGPRLAESFFISLKSQPSGKTSLLRSSGEAQIQRWLGMNLMSSVTVPQWMLLFVFLPVASLTTRGRVEAYLQPPLMWRVTLFAVSALIGLAIVTILSFAVTNVAIKLESCKKSIVNNPFIYRYLTRNRCLVVTN